MGVPAHRRAGPAPPGAGRGSPGASPSVPTPWPAGPTPEPSGGGKPALSLLGAESAGPGGRPAAADPMAAGVEQRLGSLAVFTQDDFDGDWRRVASGGFGQVFRVRHRRWRTEFAVKCSPCLQPEASRYLPAPPLSFKAGGGGCVWRGTIESQGAPQGGVAGLALRLVPSAFLNSAPWPEPPRPLCFHTRTAPARQTQLWNPQRSKVSGSYAPKTPVSHLTSQTGGPPSPWVSGGDEGSGWPSAMRGSTLGFCSRQGGACGVCLCHLARMDAQWPVEMLPSLPAPPVQTREAWGLEAAPHPPLVGRSGRECSTI